MGALVTDLMGRQASTVWSATTWTCSPRCSIGDRLPGKQGSERAAAAAVASFGGRLRLLPRDGDTAADDRLCAHGFTVALAAWMLDHDTDNYYKFAGAFVDGSPRRPDAGRHRRQHHGVLADRHRDLRRPGRTGRTHERWLPRLRGASRRRSSTCRPGSRRSRRKSSGRPAAGPRRSTRASPISTRPKGRPLRRVGKSRRSSPRSSERVPSAALTASAGGAGSRDLTADAGPRNMTGSVSVTSRRSPDPANIGFHRSRYCHQGSGEATHVR